MAASSADLLLKVKTSILLMAVLL